MCTITMEKECYVCFKKLKRAYGPKETPCCKGHVSLLAEAKENRNVLVSYDLKCKGKI